MRPSLILSTYNQPRWLEKALWGYAAQTHRAFELVVADDGSGPETAALIERMRGATGLELRHVWHEDRGFRKTEILNRAILAARGDYLIFSDGDCVPRSDFVETHVRLARPGYFLSGTCLRVSRELSERIGVDDIRTGRFSTAGWLRANGLLQANEWRHYRKMFKLVRDPRLTAFFDLVTKVPARFDGNNVSVWREAIVAVNGFDMEMGWGDEDRSLGLRLQHIGVRGKQIRHRALVVHLEHDRPYVTPEMVRRNKAIAERIRQRREVRAQRGLAELRADLALEAGAPDAQPGTVAL